jgi:nicotinate-nucleotide pyrophosphorylase (carboxylating)
MECQATLLAKQEGVISGLGLAQHICALFNPGLDLSPRREDGDAVQEGTVLAAIEGPARALLSVERTLLNFLQRLSGTATLTARFVRKVEGTGARILDTRKTTPGWRELGKYAVRCGGGTNHRMDLEEQVLIKENHLKLWRREKGQGGAAEDSVPAEAVRVARSAAGDLLVEIEVETIEQVREVLPADPDILLLDNMSPAQIGEVKKLLRQQTSRERAPLLEASGGISLRNVEAYARAGVDRISVGALTHSAPALDVSILVE